MYDGDAMAMRDRMFERGFLAGVVVTVEDEGPELVILAVTEKRTKAEMDAFVEEVASL